MVPTGNTSEVAKAYYDHLFAHYIQVIPLDRTQILWSGPFWIAFWALILIVFFFVYSKYLQSVHREEGELYGSASFAGSILERIGRVALFSYIVWAFIIAYGIYYIVVQTLRGQIY